MVRFEKSLTAVSLEVFNEVLVALNAIINGLNTGMFPLPTLDGIGPEYDMAFEMLPARSPTVN